MGHAAPVIDLPSGTQKRFSKPLKKMSREELKTTLAELGEAIDQMATDLEDAKKADPFWYFEPSTGDVTGEAHRILSEYLRPEDIPQRVDGQVDVFSSKSNINLVSGGNQSGKTTSCVIRTFIRATKQIPHALKGIVPQEIIPTKESTRHRIVCEDYTHGILNHNLPVYRQWVPREFLIDGKWEKSYSDKKDTLTLVDPKTKRICATIEFMTNQADVTTFQGPPLDGVVYDEEPRKDIYDENLLRFVTAERMDIMLGMTPTNGLTWVYDEIYENEGTQVDRDGKEKSIRCFQLTSLNNKKANLSVLREIMDRIKIYDHKKMRLLGSWISLSGLIYGGLFHRKDNIIDPHELVKGGGYLTCNCDHVRDHPSLDPMRTNHQPGCPFLDWIVFRGIDPHLVKETASVFLAINREGLHVIDTCYWRKANTTKIKADLNALARGYRMAWSRCDPSADSTLTVFDNRNVFRELSTGADRIPRLRKADKHPGSIKAGVDVIMRLLEINPATGRSNFLIADRPENQLLVTAFRTLQRETHANEEKKGMRDAIAEGKHDMHAALRYILQGWPRWSSFEESKSIPESMIPDEDAILV